MTTECKRGKTVGSRRSGGRQAGTPNRATREFRETVNELLRESAENIAIWLDSVAEGDPATGRPPDPAHALDLVIKLAEFAAPKLARIENLGTGIASASQWPSRSSLWTRRNVALEQRTVTNGFVSLCALTVIPLRATNTYSLPKAGNGDVEN